MKKITLLFAATASLLFFTSCKNDLSGLEQAMTPREVKKVAGSSSSGKVKTMSMQSSTSNEAKTAQKKGWSKAAKYAVIGSAGGAVMGAVINKRNRVKGAVIGGVLGGGGGYLFGRSKDKKDGRY